MRILIIILFLIVGLSGCGVHPQSESWQTLIMQTAKAYAPYAEKRLLPYFKRAQINYPPQQIALLIFKQERKLELWGYTGTDWRCIKIYPILAASGNPGPKLHEGDDQVPEGIYQIAGLNPESHYHLSLSLNYPNAFDRQHAYWDHRVNLGGNIFIHGHAVSIGCIAIGDAAIEELFVLVYKTGMQNVRVIIAPNDLRTEAPITNYKYEPYWVPRLYADIREALASYNT